MVQNYVNTVLIFQDRIPNNKVEVKLTNSLAAVYPVPVVLWSLSNDHCVCGAFFATLLTVILHTAIIIMLMYY